MALLVDNLIAIRILTLLVKPFIQTDAYKLGIIDVKGKNLIKPSSFTTSEQRNAYTYLHRLVFNMKKLINRLPGGENKLKSLATAFFLIKEYYERNDKSISMMESKFHKIMESNVILAEEEILVEAYIKKIEEDGEGGGGAPTNSTGAMVSTDIPVPKKKDIDKYKKGAAATGPLAGLARRPAPKV